MILGLFRRLIALVAFLGCGYLLYHYGIGDVNSQALWKGNKSPFHEYPQTIERQSSNALVRQAQMLVASSPKLSEILAISSLRQNPSSGRAATHLMSLYEAQGRDAEADQVAELASQLWPSHIYTRSNLADYWLQRNRPDKLVQEWNVMLISDGSYRKKLFPLLMEVVNSDDLAPHIEH